jgi:transcriptional regulator with XRE-family HTH domain
MKQTLDFNSFSKAIRQKRIIDMDINGREAAKKIGISHPTLSRIENHNMPDLLTYANICKWLNVPMDTFIKTARKISK